MEQNDLEKKCIEALAASLNLTFDEAEPLWIWHLECLRMWMEVGETDEIGIEGRPPVAIAVKLPDGTVQLQAYEPPLVTTTVQ